MSEWPEKEPVLILDRLFAQLINQSHRGNPGDEHPSIFDKRKQMQLSKHLRSMYNMSDDPNRRLVDEVFRDIFSTTLNELLQETERIK